MKKLHQWMIGFMLLSCDQTDMNTKEALPTCLQSIMIGSNAPLEIWGYRYNDQIVYLTKPDCCDMYELVYTTDCTVLCAPGGGFSGKGDEKCPDFYDNAKNGTLIWKKN